MEKSVFKYKVEPQYVDFTDRVSVSSICDLMLQAAGRDAYGRGFGIDALADNNFGWVLSRIAVEMDYMPSQYSEFTLHTWISDYNRLSSTRNFTLTDNEGREFGRAVSQWCMLDYATRMPVDMNTMAKAHEGNMVDAPSPCERPRRIGVITSEPVVEHRVVYSDIDFNRHMNTMRYIGLMLDMVDIEHLTANRPLRIDVHFIAECLYGQTIKVGMQTTDTATLFEVTRDDGTVACRAAFSWK